MSRCPISLCWLHFPNILAEGKAQSVWYLYDKQWAHIMFEGENVEIAQKNWEVSVILLKKLIIIYSLDRYVDYGTYKILSLIFYQQA